MGDDEELGVLEEAGEHGEVAGDVAVVKGGVEFVGETEGGGFDAEEGEEEGDGGEGAFAAGEEGYGLGLLAGGAGDDVDAGFEDVLLVDEGEAGGAAAEEAGEEGLEVGVDLLEGVGEDIIVANNQEVVVRTPVIG